MSFLDAEFLAARDALAPEHTSVLERYGIPSALVGASGWIGVSPIAVHHRGDLYEPVEDGPRAFITPVRGFPDGALESSDPDVALRYCDIVDLVAWHPMRPDRWALRRGSVVALGIVEPQMIQPPPVRVHRSPLAWLQSGGDGLALLTRQPNEMRGVLLQLRGIVAEDEAHRCELVALMSRPFPIPPVTVAASAARRAA